MIPTPQRYPVQRVELQDSCFNSLFTAEDITDIFSKVIEKNVTHQNTKTRILQKLHHQLFRSSLEEKAKRIIIKIKKALEHQSPIDVRNELSKVKEELEDVVAYVQLLAGFNPEQAIQENITQNFQLAFSILSNFYHFLHFNEVPQNKLVNELSASYHDLIAKTLADILNLNIQYIESYDRLKTCLQQLMDFDATGDVSSYLNPNIKLYYERFVLGNFQTKPTNRLIYAAIKAANSQQVDITSIIDGLPNDKRKFTALLKYEKVPCYFKLLVNCAANTQEYEILRRLPDSVRTDEKVQENLAAKLAEVINEWMIVLLKAPTPNFDDKVKKAYSKLTFFTKSMKMDINERRMVLRSIVDADIVIALKYMVEHGILDITQQDEMIGDIVEMMNAKI